MKKQSDQHLITNYGRMDVSFERGQGTYLYDIEGKKYFDALCGIAVCGLGHAHPKIADAISNQAAKLIHTSNLYRIPLQERLANRLSDISGLDATTVYDSTRLGRTFTKFLP